MFDFFIFFVMIVFFIFVEIVVEGIKFEEYEDIV